jgi:hypothetical protein
MVALARSLDDAIVARLPVVIKAHEESRSGRRIVEVEASNEAVDADGDIVLQSALLDSARSFIATGHLDIDHKSEFGARLGIPNPTSYIVGRPLDVRKGADGRTMVEGEISRSLDGHDDPVNHRYDEFWASLRRDPPVYWFASIYGWPTDLEDCSKGACGHTEATRFIIKSLDWRSLAFTQMPKNGALLHPTKIVTAKAYLLELAKAAKDELPPHAQLPETLTDAAQPCPNCEVHKHPSLLGYRLHFATCKGCSTDKSDVLAHAVMHRRMLDRMLALPAAQLGETPEQ